MRYEMADDGRLILQPTSNDQRDTLIARIEGRLSAPILPEDVCRATRLSSSSRSQNTADASE